MHFHEAIWRTIPLNENVDELGDYDMRMRRILLHHTAILGWWSSLNVVGGLLGFFWYNSFWYFFLIMGLVWGLINFLITVMVIRHGVIRRFKTGTIIQRIEAQWHLEKIMLFNIGLDLSYIFFGLFLYEGGCNDSPLKTELYSGFGMNLVMQGLFLFCMDNYIHLLHIRNYKKARTFLMEENNRGK